jgi:hypothetical protein
MSFICNELYENRCVPLYSATRVAYDELVGNRCKEIYGQFYSPLI